MLQIGALPLPPIYGARPTMYCDRVPMKNRITLATILVSATLTVMAGAIVASALFRVPDRHTLGAAGPDPAPHSRDRRCRSG